VLCSWAILLLLVVGLICVSMICVAHAHVSTNLCAQSALRVTTTPATSAGSRMWIAAAAESLGVILVPEIRVHDSHLEPACTLRQGNRMTTFNTKLYPHGQKWLPQFGLVACARARCVTGYLCSG